MPKIGNKNITRPKNKPNKKKRQKRTTANSNTLKKINFEEWLSEKMKKQYKEISGTRYLVQCEKKEAQKILEKIIRANFFNPKTKKKEIVHWSTQIIKHEAAEFNESNGKDMGRNEFELRTLKLITKSFKKAELGQFLFAGNTEGEKLWAIVKLNSRKLLELKKLFVY